MRREKKDQILAVLPEKIRGILLNHGLDFEKIQEIRLREEQPLAVKKEGKEELFTHRVTKEELRETMEYVSNYSLYAYENELRQGFLTIEGGHRVGISGKIISEKEQIRNFQYITSINIRICHEITGCANKLFPVILEKGRLCHTMIISPPGGGKTTLLRDLVRQISDGNRWVEGRNVGVVDERSEIGGCYRGVPQNQLGMRTDILDNCPKAEGMMMLVRSMAPEDDFSCRLQSFAPWSSDERFFLYRPVHLDGNSAQQLFGIFCRCGAGNCGQRNRRGPSSPRLPLL